MALATTNYSATPDDGWVLVATSPASVLVRASHGNWQVYAGVSVPANSVVGMPMQGDDTFSMGTITGNVYVKSNDALGNAGKTVFYVITS